MYVIKINIMIFFCLLFFDTILFVIKMGDNILEFSKLFSNCNFCWVRRVGNSAVHAIAKLAVSLRSSFCCNKQLSRISLLSSQMHVGWIAPVFWSFICLINRCSLSKIKWLITTLKHYNWKILAYPWIPHNVYYIE